MIKNLIIATLTLLIVGCYQKPKKPPVDVNSRQVDIDFAHISISLPKHFYNFSPQELMNAIENADSTEIPESEKRERIERVETLRLNSLGMKYYIYVDTTNINNTVIFQKGKYLKLDKEVRQQILSNTERMLKSTEGSFDLKKVDSQFFSGEDVQILKQKFEMKGPDWISYTTVYLVTTRSNTFQIIVGRADDDDFEERVTRMRVGV